jgi:ribonucleoside-diphosphate reductase beta chain
MGLLDPRLVYSPFEYPLAYEYWLVQQQAHWLHTEISMAKDITDWNTKLSKEEKDVIGSVLKGFTQMEVVVNDYWSHKVGQWFKKPEIAMMSSAFASMESIHAKAYAYLNESLGLEDFEAFMYEPTGKAKIDHLIETKGKTKRDIARSLAVFSGFAEGVQLYSSFAILLNYSQHNVMKGVGEIVSFSVKDESLHSMAGCWLFREFIREYPDLWDDELKKDIFDAAREAVKLEDAFIDQVFANGKPILGLDPRDLKEYIRYRANTKLGDLGLKSNWKNLDDERLARMDWFDYLTVGESHQDFFSGRVSEYSKGVVDWDINNSFDGVFDD